jgi:hypothetical protein
MDIIYKVFMLYKYRQLYHNGSHSPRDDIS